MADVDLFKDAYRNYLGREASDEEANNWANSVYGGGSVQDRINQIANSGEARARNPQPPQQQEQVLTPQPNTSHGYDEPQPSGGAGAPQDYAGALGNAYQQYLGRAASQDEINNWWSGAFGYGANNLNAAREAIRTSGEALAHNSGSAPKPYYQDTSYWNGQGVNNSDMFDLNTGQLKPGWLRTAQGYERTGGTSSGVPGGNFQSWFNTLTKGGVATPQALAALESQLAQYGIKLQKDSNGVIRGRLLMPDGTAVDVVSQWGQPWTWIDRGTAGNHADSGSGVGLTGPRGPANQYSDPYTSFYETLLKNFIGSRGPVNDPNRAAYEDMLKQRAQALSTGNAQLDQLMAYLQQRFTDLKGPGYTGAENEAIRTGALDPIENDRAAAKKRMMERLSAMGHTPDSGVYQMAMQEVDKAFDQMRASSQNQLTTNDLARRENRSQRAEAIGAQIADIPEMRAREQLDVFQALTNLSQVARQEDDARAREGVQYGGVLSQLGPDRLNLAMQAAGMGGNTSGLSSLLSQVAGLNQNSQAYNAQNSNSMWSGLGTLAAIIARSGQSGLSGVGI